ncbi:MAG TPA: hypothetical protein VHH32_06635 [Gemmatimonadales bacterium]|nr:hypothetical protein [Gemmatimonadales bacterium]
MARNAFALALLTAFALGGCSTIKGVLQGDKEEKAAEAKLVALRARTDSLRKARRLADSLAQVRFTVCADSVRAELNKSAAMKTKGKKKKKKAALARLSEEQILTRVQAACPTGTMPPQTTVAIADSGASRNPTADTTGKTAVESMRKVAADTARPSAQSQPTASAPARGASASSAAVSQASSAPGQDSASADSAGGSKELEMYRETFAYAGGPRDPFNSLLNMAKNGPELADLQLVGIYRNLRTPDASLAVFREKDGGKRHKLRAGDQVGRSRLIQIRERDVVFMIEDFGFERQETLSLRKQEDVAP